MDIASLSLDSLLIIFDHVFCSTLLSSVPLVCNQWNQLQPLARAKRRYLDLNLFRKLQLPDMEHKLKHWTKMIYVLHPKTFNLAYAHALVDNFPAITRLFIYNNSHIDTSEELLYLLEKWSPKLVDLDLYVSIKVSQDSVDRLMQVLNSMPRLQKLELNIPNSPKIDMPVLGRLVEIKLRFDSFDDGIVSQILKHCSTDRASHFEIGQVTHFATLAPLLLNEQLSSQIRHLNVFKFDNTQLAAIFERCHSIQTFEMLLKLEHFRERLCALANQSSLQKLKLWIAESNPPIPVASINLPVLGIETLRLNVCLTSHTNFAPITQLDRVFPRLRVVYLQRLEPNFRCIECDGGDLSDERCTEILLQSLARIADLEAVYVGNWSHRDVDWLPRLRQASIDAESAKECQRDAD